MSGIKHGDRLDQLYDLRRRTNHELQYARRHDDHQLTGQLTTLLAKIDQAITDEGGTPPGGPADPGKRGSAQRPRRGRAQKASDRVTRRLEQLGVTSHDVKVWAVSAGLLDRVRRGRIRGELVEAYATAISQSSQDVRPAAATDGD